MAEAKRRILLVEDEPNMAFSLQFNLQSQGYDVIPAVDGEVACQKFDADGPFDLVILDVMLPEKDGFEVAKHIRSTDDQIHILMLTALGKNEDRMKGFESGVDDYITKPFHLDEMLARVRRMMRRANYMKPETETGEHVLACGPFRLDTELLQLETPQGKHTLTAMETDILREFMSQSGRVLSREYLLEKVWGMRGEIETRTVDNFIVRLRRYLEVDPSKPAHLLSVRGRGYRLIASS